MKLVPFDKTAIEDICTSEERVAVIKTLIEFIESDHDCVEVVDFPHSCAVSCRSTFANAAERCGLYTVKVRLKKDRVFLIKD